MVQARSIAGWQKLDKAGQGPPGEGAEAEHGEGPDLVGRLPAVRLHTQGDDFLKETHFLRRGDPDQKEASRRRVPASAARRTPDRWKKEPPKGVEAVATAAPRSPTG